MLKVGGLSFSSYSKKKGKRLAGTKALWVKRYSADTGTCITRPTQGNSVRKVGLGLRVEGV